MLTYADISYHLTLVIHCKLHCRYEVNFQNGQDCGGAYIKLLSHDSKFNMVIELPVVVIFNSLLLLSCFYHVKRHFAFC